MPAFTLADAEGRTVSSEGLLGRGPLVLFFYPKDETLGCTAEVCGFRDSYEDFVAAGATVVGVSADSVDSHRSFAAHHRLPFVLLTDPDGGVARRFGVRRMFGILRPRRETFVIDAGGTIRARIDSQLAPGRHVRDALALVQRLARG